MQLLGKLIRKRNIPYGGAYIQSMLDGPFPQHAWDRLEHLPPTETLRKELEATLPGTKGGSDAHIEALRERVEWGIWRDERQASRPPGCWCLGFGGKGSVPFIDPTGNMLLDPRNGDPILTWRAFCACYEGQLAQARQDEATSLARASEPGQEELARVLDDVLSGMRHWTLATYMQAGGDRRLAGLMQSWETLGNDGPWLYLHGDPGVGKSGLAWPLAKQFARKGSSAAFVRAPVLLDELRMVYGSLDRLRAQEQNPWSRYENARLLVLDDLGAQRNTDWAVERLYMLIDGRYDRGLRTIITSNHDTQRLQDDMSKHDDQMGMRIVSRIAGRCGKDWIIRVTGRDLRQR